MSRMDCGLRRNDEVGVGPPMVPPHCGGTGTPKCVGIMGREAGLRLALQ